MMLGDVVAKLLAGIRAARHARQNRPRSPSPPIHPPRTFWRTGDDGVDHGAVERAMDHQRLGDGEHRRAMLLDQRLRFGQPN
jgi:hypothetical protein